MTITTEQIKALREQTGVGILDCRKALEDANGDFDIALENLRAKGLATAAKRADREATEGIVELYSHGDGRVGVMVEVNCETDFVARTDDFQNFVHDIAMHIAAASPVAVSRDEVDGSLVEKEREIYAAQMREEGKPDNIIDKIVEGKVDKYYSEIVLLEQKYVKDPDMTVEDYLKSIIGSLGENMQIKRFARFQIGG